MESTFSCCAYCWRHETSWDTLLSFRCDGCGKRVHYGCIRSPQPSPLLDDTFFNFKCEACGEGGKEEFTRSNMSWQSVVMLALYNLQKMGQGRCGYFHWKGHICAFVDQHWVTFFGHQRKKTTLWMGTVAGTLSSGCPQFFVSGTKVVEQGYWRLAQLEPPTLATGKKKQSQKKRSAPNETPVELNPGERKCRRSRESSLAAAIELKEKRSTLMDAKDIKKQKRLKLEEMYTSLREADDIGAGGSNKGGQSKGKLKKSKQRTTTVKEESTSSPARMVMMCTSEVADELYTSDSQASGTSEQSLATNASYSSSLKSSIKEEETVAQWEPVDPPKELMTVIKMEADEDEDDHDIDIGLTVAMSENMPDPRPSSPDFHVMLNSDIGETSSNMSGKSPVLKGKTPSLQMKQELQSDTESEGPSEKNISDGSDDDSDEECEEREEEDSEDDEEDEESSQDIKQEIDEDSQQSGVVPRKKKIGRPRKRRHQDDVQPPSPPPQLKRISVFEEGELLQKLNDAAAKQPLRPELAQLRRKLICNQTNREFGLPVFDLEKQMEKLAHLNHSESVSLSRSSSFFPKLPAKTAQTKETRDLDRFMMQGSSKKVESRSYTSFHQRLVGLEDHELKPVISPYTTRVLLPFIWRNYNISRKPLKLRLLQEIQAFPHRNDPSWVQPPHPPIDFCYVRPEHIPSVNALCREFFWPGIDMSECLQYPDFSCIVLYRKIVIAFAFMVPDRGYNEAYISFIFTHPEWRGAGIATFMLYHLIQTCMGKDVLLHVSATNPAMLLYQKFGFKAQELILNFYHKYFPLNSKDSLHAFLMRLSR